MTRLRELLRSAAAFHREFFFARWRSGLQQEATRQQDALLAMLFLESYGIQSPTSYFTLALYPEMVESFHEWHLRSGRDDLVGAGICC